ncbi:glycosyltransferase family 87 protein [Streptomyces olivaceus]|uniref:glycosyltransferase family 87 protein n=1 Tax=Streptomyces olivaceus TaxID=47716 RepID=UPI001CCAA64D|nr:glycosyltransferase family 87 protein [Streptomyces olivaceus]MBZ6226289.1 DUF2029 domain-containing protein [Streptomyces olivaceus]
MPHAARKHKPQDQHPAGTPFHRSRRWDWPVLVVCAVSALAVGLSSAADTSQHAWGLFAAAGYACAALAAAASPTPWARTPAVIAVTGAAAIPLLYLTAIGRAQMEVGVVERAADLLFSSGTPYNSAPHAVRDFNPYLPGMALFGIPHMLFGVNPLSSARLWSLVGFLAAVTCAVSVLTKSQHTHTDPADETARRAVAWTGALWLIACPVVALPLAIGGVDPPVIALICLALANTRRGHTVYAGLAIGAACALKWTAWPAVPVIVAVFAATAGKRVALTCAAVATTIAVLTILPAALVDGSAFYQNAVLYPFGLGHTASSAQSPLLGHLITSLVPDGRTITMALIVLSAMGIGISLLVHPPRTTTAAADRLALGLILAILLSPATRIGYAIYPVVLVIWPRFAGFLSTTPHEVEPPHQRQTLKSRLCAATVTRGVSLRFPRDAGTRPDGAREKSPDDACPEETPAGVA